MIGMNELYLSSVLNKIVINEQGKEIGRLWDLVMVPGEVFPEVSHLLVKLKKKIFAVPWRDIPLFNPVVITVVGDGSHIVEYQPEEGEILVNRDILDKQIVDINGAKVVRVNDLKLGSHKDLLCIFSVDIGLKGLLRRLGYERLWEKAAATLKREVPTQEISWEFVQPLELNASRLTLTMAREKVADMHPADIAQIISSISHRQIQTVLESLDTETAGEAIHELEPELRSQVISQLDSEQASDILEEMDPDEAADVLGDLPEEKAQELLGLMDAEEAKEVQELMEHEDDTAGGLMNNEYLALSIDMTVEDALRQVRLIASDIETVFYGYIVDKEENLLGVVSLKELLIHPPAKPIAEIMTVNLKTVNIDAEPEDILDIIAKYNLIAVPVLENNGKLAGIVTVDDILELFLPMALKRKRQTNY